jgi:diaminopimelate epimerase
MKIEFVKMHGAGNDYIYVDCFKQTIADPSEVAILMSPRHFSVGSDGLILVMPSEVADGRMRIFNADGSEGKMCGNGIRCVAKFLYDEGYAKKEVLKIETASGIKTLKLQVQNGVCVGAAVDMGGASFTPERIPVVSDEPVIEREISGRSYTCVSMGNPHAVTFTTGIDNLDIETPGSELQNSPLFPQSVNVEFCEVTGDGLKMRVWERGSGETMACGTGACASVAAAVKTGRIPAGKEIKVTLRGGVLYIKCGEDYSMTMTGEAKKVYTGIYELKDKD